MLARFLGTAGLLAALPAPSTPCTTFCLPAQDGPVFARNYDWSIGIGLVFVNKRGLSKTAPDLASDPPLRWVSRYGSVSFNQYGRELPMGGINEAGLVIEQMWLQDTRYPADDERPALRELAWIQYQLDCCASVEEVLATDALVRISGDSVPIHFLVCDRSGACATIEFLEGEMVVHRGSELLIPALANSSYADSIEYLQRFSGFGGDRPVSPSADSLDRFVRAACGVVDYDAASARESVGYAFEVLASVRQEPATRWSIVYDLSGLAVHFRTRESPAVKTLALSGLDFSPSTPCLLLDIDTVEAGDVRGRLLTYSAEANRALVFEAWKSTPFLADTPDESLERVAAHPDSIRPAPVRQDG